MSGVISCLQERGLIDQVTHPNLEEFLREKRSVYAGFDPTAQSLHIGNMVCLVVLSWFQLY